MTDVPGKQGIGQNPDRGVSCMLTGAQLRAQEVAGRGNPPSSRGDERTRCRRRLFGTGSARRKIGGKLSGSFGFGAYTYAQPTHWSRAVGRLPLAAQGEFNADVKWKVGSR
jgi:hypothetical protein